MAEKNRSLMDQQTYLNFYKETVSGYSKKAQKAVRNFLEERGAITFEKQQNLFQKQEAVFFSSKTNLDEIISRTTTDPLFMKYFEEWEFVRMYKYSVPIFWKCREENFTDTFGRLSSEGTARQFEPEKFHPERLIRTQLRDTVPLVWPYEGKYFIKFVLQKAAIVNDEEDLINYRYPVVICLNPELKILEIRYDALKYSDENGSVDFYPLVVRFCTDWLQNNLKLDLFIPDHANVIEKVNNKDDDTVRMYKQMMEMKSGGSAELTAAEGSDAVLPFIGEIKELVSENEELFDQSPEIKDLLTKYIEDKISTANYPYIYVKWVKGVDTQSYTVKITFDYLNQKFTVLQHLTGSCSDMGMGRMNDAIEYLCKSGSFTEGEKI